MNRDLLLDYLETLHKKHIALDGGEVASYIPELAKVDPHCFGITLATVDGHVYQVGDTQQPFTIQSISKVITYGIVLEDNRTEAVLRKINVEPSGEAFNSLSLEPGTGRPMNPMINAGAIAAMGLVAGDSPAAKLARIRDAYKGYLGHEIAIDEAVYRSEKETGHRNRAIAYLLHNANIIEADPDGLLDLYFKQCSILVTCRDLALLAATLANNGINPITGVCALKRGCVPKVLSVMSSCGMYDYSGAWIYEVGMPAKSGVGGGIVAVLPGQLGIAVFSPKLDEHGNSVRGIAVCRKFSGDFGLHMFHTGRATAASVLHSTYTGAQVASKRLRSAEQTQLLAEQGERIAVLTLQGDLVFASAEIVASRAMSAAQKARFIILDFRRVNSINEGAMKLFGHLVESLESDGKTVLFTGIRDDHTVASVIKEQVPQIRNMPVLKHEDADHALEWCENQLLAGLAQASAEQAPMSAQCLCAGFTEDELRGLQALLEPKTYSKGTYVFTAGTPAAGLYFILSGQASVVVPVDRRRTGRIATLSAGSSFGELGLFDDGDRSASIVADTDLSCMYLDYESLRTNASGVDHEIKLKLMTNIGRLLSQTVRRATVEIKALKR